MFTLLAAIIFHNFWAATRPQNMNQQINFMKNLSIAGGMLVLAAFGPGAISIEARRLAASHGHVPAWRATRSAPSRPFRRRAPGARR